MSRIRATLSASPIDREIQGQIAVAERAIEIALRACQRARKDDQYGHAHVARVRRDLERALGALRGVRRVVPSYDRFDPDLQPTAPYEPPGPMVTAEEPPAEVGVAAEEAAE